MLNNSHYSIGLPIRRRQFNLVLSYYAENVDFTARFIKYIRNVTNISKLNPYAIVYNKNSNVNITYLKIVLKVDLVKTLPNVGREGATYLTHIIENYDTLADHTFFTQAGFEGLTERGPEKWLVSRLEKQFNMKVGYMPMVTDSMITNYDCGKNRYNGDFPRLAELWGILEQTLCPPGGQAVSYRGQFLVSRRRIHTRPLDVYKYIQSILTANPLHWIHKDNNHEWLKSTPDKPIFGHVVERLWTILFHCTSPDLVTSKMSMRTMRLLRLICDRGKRVK